MLTIENAETLRMALYLVVPGIVILFSRAYLLTGQFKTSSEAFLSYFTISSLYWAAIFSTGLSLATIENYPLLTMSLVFVLPFIIGFGIGYSNQKDWPGIISQKIGSFSKKLEIQTTHPIETAWDYAFWPGNSFFLDIETKDGKTIHAQYSSEKIGKDTAFVSFKPGEQDLLVYEAWYNEATQKWEKKNTKIWISKEEIKIITFHGSEPA